MKTRILCLALLCSAALYGAAPAPQADARQRVIHLGDDGVTVIDLHAYVDGRPLRAAWTSFMDRMFEYLDRDGDGVLSAKEQKGMPPVSMLTGPGFGGLRVIGAGKDKTKTPAPPAITRDAFRERYRSMGVAPLAVSTDAGGQGFILLSPDGTMPGRNDPEELNTRLFKLLDADGDGTLSEAELKAAAATLMKLDKDEDELVAPAELRGAGPSNYEGGGGAFTLSLDSRSSKTAADLVAVDADRPDDAAAQALLSRYGKGAKSLKAAHLGLSPKAFRSLDADGNGELDAKELSRIGTLPADIELELKLGGRRDGEHACRLLRSASPRAKVSVKDNDGGAVLEIGRTHIELTGPAAVGRVFNIDTRSQYVTFFRTADADNNGYLDRAEAEKSPVFGNLFETMDRDGDGMLFEKEVTAYLDKTESFREGAKQGCRTLRLRDVGQGLFDRIDTDKDGRLSLRELRAMPDLLKTLDGDGDGKLAPQEMPRRLQATADEGPAGGGFGGGVAIVMGFGPGGDATAGPERAKGPGWFRKMDRNRDGDVSRAEWLGTEAEFKDADADGDGLISWQEAEAYDKRKRERK